MPKCHLGEHNVPSSDLRMVGGALAGKNDLLDDLSRTDDRTKRMNLVQAGDAADLLRQCLGTERAIELGHAGGPIQVAAAHTAETEFVLGNSGMVHMVHLVNCG